jgi:hypothetical protein
MVGWLSERTCGQAKPRMQRRIGQSGQTWVFVSQPAQTVTAADMVSPIAQMVAAFTQAVTIEHWRYVINARIKGIEIFQKADPVITAT